jgi:hypothetical protein
MEIIQDLQLSEYNFSLLTTLLLCNFDKWNKKARKLKNTKHNLEHVR